MTPAPVLIGLRQGTVYIEDRLAAGQIDAALVFGSLFAELELLSSAQMVVGTAASWVSRLTFLMIVGRQGGRPPPFEWLDSPFGCLNIKPCPVKM